MDGGSVLYSVSNPRSLFSIAKTWCGQAVLYTDLIEMATALALFTEFVANVMSGALTNVTSRL